MPQTNSDNSFASIFTNKAFAQEYLKINSINFDNSDSIIFLGTSGSEEDLKITKKVLSDPDRVFFDIENAVITFPNSTFELKNSRLTKVRIAQNSVDPNIVRIVIWNNPNYDASQIKVLQIKNNIIIKLTATLPMRYLLCATVWALCYEQLFLNIPSSMSGGKPPTNTLREYRSTLSPFW